VKKGLLSTSSTRHERIALQGALMKRISLLLALSANMLSYSVFAGHMGSVAQQTKWPLVGSINVGPAWQSNGHTQTFYLAPGVEKTYTANSSTNAMTNGEIFLGFQKNLLRQLQSQLGLAVGIAGTAKLSGNIWDDASPQFNNYTYNYKVNQVRIALKGKLLADRGYWITPWVSGSLGVGFNHAYSFHNTPTIFEALPNTNFSSNTQTTFTFTLGAGLQRVLNQHWQVGIGYEFADWGKSQLHRASGQTLNSGLSLNYLFTNGVLFNLTYLV
jgi:opacity protein-like surface antigen